MASLMENLMTVLESENTEYGELLELSTKKTTIIIEGNIQKLTDITAEEQEVVEKITRLEKKREEAIQDIGDVLKKDVATLKLIDIVHMLGNQPDEQEKLATIHTRLKETLARMVKVNEENKLLIATSLELVEFDLNLIQSVNMVPETANYNKGAYSAGNTMGSNLGKFDAKQ